eukprot:CCRYP_021235-RA/>CCRYP_021235-RA protein AED:0.36 eAED:0.38 QI:0/0/0/1/0/0/2/0/404
MNQVFANRNEEDSIYPLTTREIVEEQQEDESLQNKGCSTHLVENTKVLCKDGKIVIPKSLQHRAVAWFHHYLQHPGTKRLKERNSLSFNVLERSMNDNPITCQKVSQLQGERAQAIKIWEMPTKLVITNPWEALCVDLIGPYTLNGKDKTQIDFICITMIDPTTSWFKIVKLPVSQLHELDIPMGTKGQRNKDTHIQAKQSYFDKSSAKLDNIINRTWCSCYPTSQYAIYNNGSEFKLHFETLCHSYGLKHKPTSVRNLQANETLELVCQVIMAMLHTAGLDMTITMNESDIADFLTNAALAVCSTYHTVLKTSPGASYLWTGHVTESNTDKNTRWENETRVDWDYQPGDKVLLQKDGILHKTDSRYESGPWTITSVHTNGTISVQRGTKSERLNSRRVTPYFQ